MLDFALERFTINNCIPGSSHPLMLGPVLGGASGGGASRRESGAVDDKQPARRHGLWGRMFKSKARRNAEDAAAEREQEESPEAQLGHTQELAVADKALPLVPSAQTAAAAEASAGLASAGALKGGAASGTSAVGLRVILESHPALLYISELSFRLARMSVNIDDELIMHILQLATSLNLSVLSESTADQDIDTLLADYARKRQRQLIRDMRTLQGATGRPVPPAMLPRAMPAPGISALGQPAAAAQVLASGGAAAAASTVSLLFSTFLAQVGRLPGAASHQRLLCDPALQRRERPVSPSDLVTATKVYIAALRLAPLDLDVTFGELCSASAIHSYASAPAS